MPLAEINTDTPKDLATIWVASPAEAEGWVVLTTGLVDKLAGPPTPTAQIGGEKHCVLMVTASVGRLNLEATGVTSGDTMIASVGGVAFGNPHMGATSQDPQRKEGGGPLGYCCRGADQRGLGRRQALDMQPTQALH